MKRFLAGLITAAILFPLCVDSAVVGDINQDGKIDLMESIYALQVASGIYPTIEDSCLLTGKGVWEDGVTYNLCDVVTSSGITYACAIAHISAIGSIEPSNTSYWTVLSIKGDTGETGLPGTGPINQSCLPGKNVTGFDANGYIVCQYPPKYVFVTDGSFYGNLGGVEGADNICQTEAVAAYLSGTYKAWISDSTHDPVYSFTHNKGNYILTNGLVVATDWYDLTDGTLQHAINVTPGGQYKTTQVWTGTHPYGFQNPELADCDDWRSTDSYGVNGSSDQIDERWTAQYSNPCNGGRSLYCFEQ